MIGVRKEASKGLIQEIDNGERGVIMNSGCPEKVLKRQHL